MSDYNEFRVVLAATNNATRQWSASLTQSPDPTFAGLAFTIDPALQPEDIAVLRAASDWPNIGVLQAVGRRVWKSVMAPLQPAFRAARALSEQQGRGLRLVLVRHTEDIDSAPNGGLSLADVPFEVLCDENDDFVALDVKSPVSRGINQVGLHAARITPPLRILIVVAKPSGQPQAGMDDEVAAIRAELAAKNGQVQLTVCADGTYATFAREVQERMPHVIHFIGHGSFAPAGNDPTEVPHLSFVRADGESDPVSAETFKIGVQNSGVHLAVLTACSTAAPALPGGRYDPIALEGFAQRLVRGKSRLGAAVAMQFDFEAKAAVTFSRALYKRLLEPGRNLDEAVTFARRDLVAAAGFGAGHRAWVTPTVCSCYVGGKVFEIEAPGTPSAAALADLQSLDSLLAVYLDQLGLVARSGAALPDLVRGSMAKVKDIQRGRSELLGQTLRLSVEHGAAGDVQLQVLLRLAAPCQVDLVKLAVEVPVGLTLVRGAAATGFPDAPVPGAAEGNIVPVFLAQPAGGTLLPAGEHVLGSLVFRTKPAQSAQVFSVLVSNPEMFAPGRSPLRPLAGVLFVDA